MLVKLKNGRGRWNLPHRLVHEKLPQRLLALGLALAWLAQGGTVHAAAGNPYESLLRLEQSLYAKQYAHQTVGQRLHRIELSLMGQTQPGTFTTRIEAIEDRLAQLHDERATSLEQERTLGFVEQRLYQQVQSRLPVSDRLDHLETTLYGQSRPQFPLAERLARLRQAIPLNARTIRLQTHLAPPNPAEPDLPANPLLLPEPPGGSQPAVPQGSAHDPSAAPIPAEASGHLLMAVAPAYLPPPLSLDSAPKDPANPPPEADSPDHPPSRVASQPVPNQRYDTPQGAVERGEHPPMAVRFQRWLLLWWLSAASR